MKFVNKSILYTFLVTLLLGIFIGWLVFGGAKKTDSITQTSSEHKVWTCTMHPQIRMTEAGDCPICGMELVPLKSEPSSSSINGLKMSPTAMQLASVQTSIVRKQIPVKEIRLTGKVKADETKVFSQASHIKGRIERLMINFTGEEIRKGQIVAYIYSPELVTAQEELLQAYNMKDSQGELYEATREKLRNWKLTERQIDNIVTSGKRNEVLPIYADVSGIVTNKRVNTGDYIQKGQSLYEVANLNSIWVLFDVYESDLQWIKKGDLVDYTVQSISGKTFSDKIMFIDPVIDPVRRVATARVEVSNTSGLLKPDMFATAIVKTSINLKSKSQALIIPKSAVMWTGERSLVYIKEPTSNGASFVMREVTLGAILGDGYIIKDGLEEGEEVVTNGTFSIDAAAQLAGKPSMMNPAGGAVSTGHNHGAMSWSSSMQMVTSKESKEAVNKLLSDYFLVKDALVEGDFLKSKDAANSLLNKLNRTNMNVFKGEAHNVWMKNSAIAKKVLKYFAKAQSIKEVRTNFIMLSSNFSALANAFGPFSNTTYIYKCPMANDNKGASWLGESKDIRNPYYGSSMLNCGEIIKEIK